jgi:hypothetical protein
MKFFKSAALVSLVPFALLSCGSSNSEADISAVPAPFATATLINNNKTVRIVYKGKTRDIHAQNLSVYLYDHPCANVRPGMPKNGTVKAQFFTSVKVNNIAGTPTSGHVAVGINLDYCALVGVGAAAVIKPKADGSAPAIQFVQIAKIRGGNNVPPATGTYAFNDVSSVAFAQSGKLLVNHVDAAGSSARIVVGNPAGTAPIGKYERCEVIELGESGALCPWAN